MIMKGNDPWTKFLYARKMVIEFLIKEHNRNFEQIAKILSMDSLQVQLIHMTKAEKE